jgi:hypothetical protein
MSPDEFCSARSLKVFCSLAAESFPPMPGCKKQYADDRSCGVSTPGFLVWGILLMVLCSLTVGASLIFSVVAIVAVGLFILGLFAMSSGLFLVLSELRVSLEAIEFEQENIKRL